MSLARSRMPAFMPSLRINTEDLRKAVRKAEENRGPGSPEIVLRAALDALIYNGDKLMGQEFLGTAESMYSCMVDALRKDGEVDTIKMAEGSATLKAIRLLSNMLDLISQPYAVRKLAARFNGLAADKVPLRLEVELAERGREPGLTKPQA